MSKKLIHKYTFDASARTIVLGGIYGQDRLLMITNLTDNTIVYLFNSPELGLTNYTIDTVAETTTLNLVYDTSTMSDTDSLQVFIEADSQTFLPDKTYTDPVSKFRVSQPENLIDTDFEYGLQSTKWETLELTKNIPTFYARNGDQEIGLSDVTTFAQSDIITVTTTAPHGLQRGSPVIIVGTSTPTADGGFLVASVPDTTTFTYKCKAQQSTTTSILETYAQLFAGSIYSGTEFKLANIGGITTDGGTPSTLTVNTQYPTNFTNGTSMSLANTFAKATVGFNTNNIVTGNVISIDQSYTNATATGETSGFTLGGVNSVNFDPVDWSGRSAYYFEEGSLTVDTVENSITFPSAHGYSDLDSIIYICDTASNTAIGGLTSMRGYWVDKINDTTIRLRNTRSVTSTTNTVSLTSNGVSGGVIKSAFAPGVGQGVTQQVASNDNYYYYAVHGFNSTDRTANRYFPIRNSSNANILNVTEPLNLYDTNVDTADWYARYVNTTRHQIQGTGTSGITAISDTTADFHTMRVANSAPLGSSIYLPSHGLRTDDVINITATVGTLPAGLVSGTNYRVVRVSDDRISFKDLAGTAILFSSAGSANLVYRVTATLPVDITDTITIANNQLNDGDAVVYDVNSGTEIGGLTDGTTYYIARKTGDGFNLSTTPNVIEATISIPNQASATYVDVANNYIIGITHGLTTGQAFEYISSTPIVGLRSGVVYYARSITSTSFSIHPTAADAVANTNTVVIYGLSSGTGSINRLNLVDLTSAPSGELQYFVANFVGAADGVYEVTSTAGDGSSFNLSSSTTVLPRTIAGTCQELFVPSLDGFFFENHGLLTGNSVVYTETGTVNITGLTDSTTYYVIRKSKDIFQLATSQVNATNGVAIALSDSAVTVEQTGTIDFAGTSIVGGFIANGTISYEADAFTISGLDTSFTSYFNKGDSFFIDIPPSGLTTALTFASTASDYFTAAGHGLTDGTMIRFTGTSPLTDFDFDKCYFVNVSTTGLASDRFKVYYSEADAIADTNVIDITSGTITSVSVTGYPDSGSVVERIISYVNSDTQITVTEALPSTGQATAYYFLNTKLLLRSDGFALHRPYDGGVELIPSSNPDSQMIRQTRKYFRYQSGKGIQVSYAINFSPPSSIDTFTRSGTTGTITTRFPHRLTAGLNITTFGSTNTSTDTIGTKTHVVTVADSAFIIDGAAVTSFNLYEGRTYRFDQSDSSNASAQLLFSLTSDGDNNGGVEFTSGVTKVGTAGSAGAYTQITVPSGIATLYTYVSGTADYGFEVPTLTDPANNLANLWNGSMPITSIVNDLTFQVQLPGTPSDSEVQGIVQYYVDRWINSSLKCGLFDDQNGLYFEYDGSTMYCCRRSSTLQLSGYATVEFRSGAVTGSNTKWNSQLAAGDYIVIKGQSYQVNRISSDTLMYITPSYRGVDNDKVIITKTTDTRVAQDDWNEDICDGTGPSGFALDVHKIQMAYIAYSWYGAGKVRFGFKDQYGNVKYVHEFIHNNRETEAYMRSGNLPARYEIFNQGAPTYVPALPHWGTSVIMDGRFDDDKAYVFNASSNNITVTGAASLTTDAKVDYLGTYTQRIGRNNYTIGYALLLDTADANLAAVTSGIGVSGAGLASGTIARNPISTAVTPYQPYLPSVTTREGTDFSTQEVRNLFVIDKQPTATAGTSSTYTFDITGGGSATDLTAPIPLISIRLSPSVDTGTPGFLGEREILNRMQLILQQVGILSTHAIEVRLVLNGQVSSNAWQRVNNPSLSQLVIHTSDDTIVGGASVFKFRAAGGAGTADRTQVLTVQDLGEVATLGNSIMGGDGTYPDGPDVLTVVAILTEDPSTVSSSNPYIVSGRISWAESQA